MNFNRCYSGGVEGVCVSVSAGCCSGGYADPADLCPGSQDIQCCVNTKCYTPGGSGTCMQTSLCSSKGGVSDPGDYCPGPQDIQCCVIGGSQSNAISRAKTWINPPVPYNQQAYYGGYRTDCSGYVSMAWQLSYSATTWTLPNHSYQISKDALQPGDILLNINEHVLIFAGWADSARTQYWAYEETPPQAVYHIVQYPYWHGYNEWKYLPYRFNGVRRVQISNQTESPTSNPITPAMLAAQGK